MGAIDFDQVLRGPRPGLCATAKVLCLLGVADLHLMFLMGRIFVYCQRCPDNPLNSVAFGGNLG